METGGGAADEALLERMSALIAHRGPDASGTVVEGAVGLAHRRLAIIDLSDEGCQPMTSGDGALTLVFNGEIFNYLELREELRAAGHAFRTGTDTEVVLAAYAAWGRDCLARFNGMWAFAILDRRRGEVFLARDRLGVKPLYYTLNGDRFLFASECKALLADPAVGTTPCEPALATFLAWGVLDHSPLTMFEGVLQLPPGHWMADRRGRGRGAGPLVGPRREPRGRVAARGRGRCAGPTARASDRRGPPPAPGRRPGRDLPLGRDRLLDPRRP